MDVVCVVFMCVTSTNDNYVHSLHEHKQNQNNRKTRMLTFSFFGFYSGGIRPSPFRVVTFQPRLSSLSFFFLLFFFRRSMRIHHPFGTSFPGVWSASLSGSVDIFIYSKVHRKSRLKSTWYCDSCYYCMETKEKKAPVVDSVALFFRRCI